MSNELMRTLITVLFPLLLSIGIDLSAFGRAKETAKEQGKPKPEWNWPLALGRWIAGLCTGLTTAGLVQTLGG